MLGSTMSFTLMAQAIRTPTGNATTKWVLVKLCDNASDEGECWPSLKTIAGHCELSRPTVVKHIEKLIQLGLLRKEGRTRVNGSKASNLYTITLLDPSKGSLLPPSNGSLLASKGSLPAYETIKETINNNKDIASNEAPSKQASKAPAKKYSKKDKKIAKLHYKEVLAANPKTTIKFDVASWSNAVRLLRTVQKYSHTEIAKALEFARQSAFWATNAQSIPALRGRSKNGLLKFENLFADLKADTFSKDGSAHKNEFSAEGWWDDDPRCVKICNSLTAALSDKFHDDRKITELVNLVETIDHMTTNETTMWRSLKDNYMRFSRGSLHNAAAVTDWDAYPNFFNKKEGREGFIGFKDLQLGSELFSKFEDWVCKSMRIGHSEAMEDLMGKSYRTSERRKKAWKKYLKGLDTDSDSYYFTEALPTRYTNQ